MDTPKTRTRTRSRKSAAIIDGPVDYKKTARYRTGYVERMRGADSLEELEQLKSEADKFDQCRKLTKKKQNRVYLSRRSFLTIRLEKKEDRRDVIPKAKKNSRSKKPH